MEDTKRMFWNEPNSKSYGIPTVSIPRLSYKDPLADKLIANMKPVVLTDTNLVGSAMKWDSHYLQENLGDSPCTVYLSKTHKFKYFDANQTKKCDNDFSPPTEQIVMRFQEFVKRLKSWKEGDKRLYMQEPLNEKILKSLQLVNDILTFNWGWARMQQKQNNWGPLTTNLLMISTQGNVTPAHFDNQHNLFAQIYGYKRFILFPPEDYDKLYPHPVWHPHDRQSQVDFDYPDYTKFPKFHDIKGHEALLGPGDVLYLPLYWWHHVESLLQTHFTISLNFWYKAGPNLCLSDSTLYPLEGYQKMAIMRNVEKMLVEALRDVNEVGPLLRTILEGRYN
ncbi:hypoxia-inducible factor 1-alpha inhibitor-like isoform X1 [Limulus polyphemus]|uniref:Hypoxia-inducible factor 1-alpha inhibitor-like isoform X1 n=2 Tax=Limulus polyphemus TaxID=6850 RepID=A0ABM1B555_LIMPO|nr:hypoxia-inducible factor 1-alpha inhibitor-like isoform X1 [Limulus polyphemus]